MAAAQHLVLKENYKNPSKHICLIPVGFWVGNKFKLCVNLMRIKKVRTEERSVRLGLQKTKLGCALSLSSMTAIASGPKELVCCATYCAPKYRYSLCHECPASSIQVFLFAFLDGESYLINRPNPIHWVSLQKYSLSSFQSILTL